MNSSPDPGTGFVIGLFLVYGFVILLALAAFVFWVVEIIDVVRRQFREPNMKIVWLLVVFFLHGLGAIIYYFAGKPTGWLPGETPRSNYPPNYPPNYPQSPPPPGQWPPPPGSV